MPRLPHHHLHRLLVDGKPLPLVVNGRSVAAVRDHFIERHLRIERLTPEEAFQAGVRGAAIETVGTSDNTPQPLAQAAHEPTEPGLFDTLNCAARPAPDTASERASSGERGAGYAAAVQAASTL
jgi:hypothetical protein